VARDTQLAASSWVFSSELHLTESRLDDALADARQALATAVPVTHRWAAVTMARVELALGRPRAALETIAMALSSTVPMQAHVDAWLHLVRAEALHALGEVAAAHDTIRVARTRIQETAAVLTRPDLRDSFLSRVEPNRRTLELARQWLGDPGTPVGAS
jgi:ATP/maltotriose-dependent transcriptional regulator MalT